MSKDHILLKIVKNEKVVKHIDQLVNAIPNLKVKIETPRNTKLGYMKHDIIKNLFIISINNNLSPSKFLYVFLHEYAHLLVSQKYKNAKPHGYEWQIEFFKLLKEAIQKELFHKSIAQTILKEFFYAGVYSKQRDFTISIAIDKADHTKQPLYIKDLKIGTFFTTKNGMQFQLLEKKRTRYLCNEIKTNKKYLISSYATVVKVLNPPLKSY